MDIWTVHRSRKPGRLRSGERAR